MAKKLNWTIFKENTYFLIFGILSAGIVSMICQIYKKSTINILLVINDNICGCCWCVRYSSIDLWVWLWTAYAANKWKNPIERSYMSTITNIEFVWYTLFKLFPTFGVVWLGCVSSYFFIVLCRINEKLWSLAEWCSFRFSLWAIFSIHHTGYPIDWVAAIGE